MECLTKWYVRLSEKPQGQTMAEYGLIMSAVAVVAIVAYNLLGTNVTALVNKVAGLL